MIKYLLGIVCVLFMMGCGPQGYVVAHPDPYPSPSPVVEYVTQQVVQDSQEDINMLVAQKNTDRAVTAQAPLTNGLSCVVQQVSSGQCLNTSSIGCSGLGLVMTGTSYTYLYQGLFNQPDSAGSDTDNLLPVSLQPLFTSKNFRIVCSGQLVITTSDYYEVDLSSDDGSILTVDGSQVVNNDNNHGMTTRSGTALLYRGIHSLSLQYAQTGSGNYGLTMLANGSTVDPKYYYH